MSRQPRYGKRSHSHNDRERSCGGDVTGDITQVQLGARWTGADGLIAGPESIRRLAGQNPVLDFFIG